MNFALDFRSQRQFFAELISPGGPNHQKKFLRFFWKIKNFEVLKLCEMNFALGFRSQRQFFVDLISPVGPNHQKKI